MTRLKLKYQKRALCRKNLTLQGRQKLTNVCQILTPITGLFVVQSLKNLGESSMRAVLDKTLYIPVPFLFNVPYMPLQSLVSYFNISDCDQWYLYDFASDASEDTRHFWGMNRGDIA